MNYDLSELNDEQIKPVLDTEGAVLVTAGAGSGKTRLLTHRIAYIIDKGLAKPYEILAITFTNKAANEMRTRLDKMLPISAGDVWVFTFHALCVRILRRYIKNLGGYTSSFSIYGEQEKEHCIKEIVRREDYEDDTVKTAISVISAAKSVGMSPDEFDEVYAWRDDIDILTDIFFEYEKTLKKNNALDYDDLLIKARTLLKTDAEAREYFQNKFRYIHVDEFQDTNAVQYDLVKILSAKHGNVFVVGDEDQSIYGWRGANFANIFDFTKDFPAKVYKLEQNYRSSKKIVSLANRIIGNNISRLDKVLWTENGDGAEVVYYPAYSDGDEADFVIRNIVGLQKLHGYSFSDFAILMRINSLSRAFEERLIMYGLPHKIYGGFKFYDRKEIKDLLAYLKILGNSADDEAIGRIINFPRRGIGETTVKQLKNYAAVKDISLFDVITNLETNEDLPNSIIKKVLPFSHVLNTLVAKRDSGSTVADLIMSVIKILGLKELYAEDTDENEMRKNNIRELVGSIEQFEQLNPGATLWDYLQQISLYSDLDEMDNAGDSVSIATIHSAKGLEFKVVFLVGLEQGIFPDTRRAESLSELEEERRLMYVAVTRAKERLFLSMAKSRFRYGERKTSVPSSFLAEGGFEAERESAYAQYSGSYDSVRSSASTQTGVKYSRVPPESAQKRPEPVRAAVSQPQSVDSKKYVVGTRIRHKKFGEGTVVRLVESGDPYIEVEFEGKGKLMLLLAYAPIEVIA